MGSICDKGEKKNQPYKPLITNPYEYQNNKAKLNNDNNAIIGSHKNSIQKPYMPYNISETRNNPNIFNNQAQNIIPQQPIKESKNTNPIIENNKFMMEPKKKYF